MEARLIVLDEIEITLTEDGRCAGKVVPVHLRAAVTEVGTLELQRDSESIMKIMRKTVFVFCKSLFLCSVGEALASQSRLKPLPHEYFHSLDRVTRLLDYLTQSP